MTAPPPLEQIDLLLAAWDERLARMDDNLVALESEAVYQALAGDPDKRGALSGVTRDRVGPALTAVAELFEDRVRLAAVIAKAKEVRASISSLTFWETDDKIAEIHRLLRGTSVELGPEVVALSDRRLLGESHREVMIEPERLLAEMAQRFEGARTVLVAIARAWETLAPEIAAVEREMREIRALSRALGGGEIAELTGAEAELARLAAAVERDPLGVQGGVRDHLAPRLAAARARLDHEAAAKQRVGALLDRARDERRRLAEIHRRAEIALAEARRGVEGEAARRLPSALDEARLAGLDGWLEKLEGTIEARRWSPAEVGLTRWITAAEEYRAEDERAAAAAAALAGRHDELKGRLAARRAQAAALAARGAVIDPSIDALARGAEALLRKSPFPADEAARAVESYEAAIIALAARRP